MSHCTPRGMEPALPYETDADVTMETTNHNAGWLYFSVNIMLGIYYPTNSDQKVIIWRLLLKVIIWTFQKEYLHLIQKLKLSCTRVLSCWYYRILQSKGMFQHSFYHKNIFIYRILLQLAWTPTPALLWIVPVGSLHLWSLLPVYASVAEATIKADRLQRFCRDNCSPAKALSVLRESQILR